MTPSRDQTSTTAERAAYNRRRADALRAIELASGGRTMSLDQVAALLPDHPEWERYFSQRRRGAR